MYSCGFAICKFTLEIDDDGANGNGGAINPPDNWCLFTDNGGTTGGLTYAAFGFGLIFGMSTFGIGGMFVALRRGVYVFGVKLLKFVDKQLSFSDGEIGNSLWFSELAGGMSSGLEALLQVSEHWEHDDREQFEAEKVIRN